MISATSRQSNLHEVEAMSDVNPKAIYSALSEDSKRGPLAKPLLIARAIAIVAAIGGAIPTAVNLYHSWAHGIPYSQVSHRLAQYELWMKNLDCKVDYRALNVNQGTRVDVGACTRSGDIAIKVSAPGGKSSYEWIAFDKLQTTGKTASLMSLIISEAQADSTSRATTLPALPPSDIKLAQATPPGSAPAGMQVQCQALASKTSIIRIVNESGKCFRENFSPFQGKVDKREEVPCNTQCPPAGKG
jgi:hypothetical protein